MTTDDCPPRIRFFKMTGSGNDFIIIDNMDGQFSSADSPELVRLACRRKLSVGADGLIFIEPDARVDFCWRFYNADGSEAEMCGNGARCAARFAYLRGIVRKPQIAFRTVAGIIHAEIIDARVKIQVSPPHGLELNFPLDVEGKPFHLNFINTGVPHVVHFLADKRQLDAAHVFTWGRALRFHQRFQPAGANVNFAAVEAVHRMAVRTYERGVEDETLACGTGSIAAALIGAALDQVESPVEVVTRSGETLTVYFARERQGNDIRFMEVYLEGAAKVVYEADLWDETLRE